MEQIKLAGELRTQGNEGEPMEMGRNASELRTLADLELLYVGGGNDVPTWP